MAEILSFTYDDLSTLHSIAKILAKAMPLREQLEQVLNELSTKAGMKRGMISILDRETGDAVLDVAHELDITGLQISYKPGEGITGQVAQTCRPMAVPSLGKDSLFLDRTGARKEVSRTDLAFLCVPIIYEGQAVGVLSADKVSSHVYTLDYELQLLSEVAGLMAKAVHMRRIEEENIRLKDMLSRSKHPFPEFKGNSRIMKEVFALISQVADSSTSVLIHGETGTGKELVARAIHHGSPRRDGPFIEVNCAAMPDTLIESELFGHEKGAFTGAHQRRRGKFEEAHGGTIFLDEIGELSPMAQAKLLRVLQEKQFQPLARIAGVVFVFDVNRSVPRRGDRELTPWAAERFGSIAGLPGIGGQQDDNIGVERDDIFEVQHRLPFPAALEGIAVSAGTDDIIKIEVLPGDENRFGQVIIKPKHHQNAFVMDDPFQ